MKREYVKWFSPCLQREMELLVFGDAGSPVLFFPTRMGRFYDYENWGLIKALEEKIVSGKNQLYCIDSIDADSFYCKGIPPIERIYRYTLYEKYILEEVIPFVKQKNNNELISFFSLSPLNIFIFLSLKRSGIVNNPYKTQHCHLIA